MSAEPEKLVLAFDLGGTKLHAGLIDEAGTTRVEEVVPTAAGRDDLLASFQDTARKILERAGPGVRVVGTGVGTAGVIDREGGAIRYAPNLPLDGFPLGAHLAGLCPNPVVVLNDGRAAAMGEYAYGELAGRDPMVCLFYGTGIGIGVVVEGRLLAGFDNAAGEIGHTIYHPDGPRCNCGKKGCFEALGGGGAMSERARREIGPPPEGGRWRVDQILAAARAGDAAGARILAEGVEALQVLTANVVTLVNPGALVLGGGVLQGLPELEERIAEGIARLVHPAVCRNLRIARSRLGARAILCGAAAAVRAETGR